MQDVLDSRPIADPLRLLDCCPVSDGGAAFVVTADPPARPRADRPPGLRISGVGEAHRHQHLSEADLDDLGAGRAAQTALRRASRTLADIDVAGIYDSFTITLAMLLEEIGLSQPGRAGDDAAAGVFDRDGRLPLNTHGGLLSYGHCGVARRMAHLAEVATQLRGAPGDHAIAHPARAGLVHADGGVMSAHVSIVLEAETRP